MLLTPGIRPYARCQTEKQKAKMRAMGVPENMDAAGGLSEYLKKLYDDDEDDAAAAVLALLLGENIEDDAASLRVYGAA